MNRIIFNQQRKTHGNPPTWICWCGKKNENGRFPMTFDSNNLNRNCASHLAAWTAEVFSTDPFFLKSVHVWSETMKWNLGSCRGVLKMGHSKCLLPRQAWQPWCHTTGFTSLASGTVAPKQSLLGLDSFNEFLTRSGAKIAQKSGSDWQYVGKMSTYVPI